MRNDISLESYNKLLDDRLKETTESRGEISPVELDQARVGRLSRMDAMQQQAMARAAARLNEAEEQRIRTALDRIASGDYGYCIQCEEEIAAHERDPFSERSGNDPARQVRGRGDVHPRHGDGKGFQRVCRCKKRIRKL